MNYGTITAVEPDSPAELAGMAPGDRLISINGNAVRDVIDYRFYSAEDVVDLVYQHGDDIVEVVVEKDIDEPLGLDFDQELFDGIRTCDNCCIFCFVHQLPKGMRKSLYIRDDDYRLSFLHGNFITLTAAGDEDLSRIIEQRLSPLYISVHSTDEALRRELLCNSDAPEIMPRLRTLAEGGITLHTQIVLCPGLNDGPHLEKSIEDLSSIYPAVQSIAVVPVGLTRHRRGREQITQFSASRARQVLSQVRRWQRRFQGKIGRRLVYASDELYLIAGARIPRSQAYEGFPQLENGVGIVRRFLDSAARTIRRFPKRLDAPVKAILLTGVSAGPILKEFTDQLNRTEELELKVEAIENDFFGHMVTVAGLLSGRDVIAQLKHKDSGNVLILPSVFLREGLFLDDVPVEQVEKELGLPVHVVPPHPAALAAKILELSKIGKKA